MQQMSIGQLASAAGVNVETVRYYQRRGILGQPPRRPGSIARYPASSLVRLRFIRRARGFGFSLEEVQALLSLQDSQDCATARAIGENKLAQIRERIHALRELEQSLADMVGLCAQAQADAPCPMIDQLMQEAQCGA